MFCFQKAHNYEHMSKIKIGDIVQPTTPKKHKRYGRGVVIGNERFITAVFPSAERMFVIHDFRKDLVAAVDINEEQRKKIDNAEIQYRRLIIASNSA